jgi:hypothetical protein
MVTGMHHGVNGAMAPTPVPVKFPREVHGKQGIAISACPTRSATAALDAGLLVVFKGLHTRAATEMAHFGFGASG